MGARQHLARRWFGVSVTSGAGGAVGVLVFQSAAVGCPFSVRRERLLAAAFLKNRLQLRAWFQTAAAISVVLLCTLGLAGKAQAQGVPIITNVSPNTGPPGGGTAVTITGDFFTGTTAVSFGGKAAAFTFTAPNQITATSPAGTGAVDIIMTNTNGPSIPNPPTDQFTYAAVGSMTSLASSPNPSSGGQPVKFTAKVTGATPTGTVTFFDNGTQIGTATLTGGTATFTTSSLTTGSHSITARYSGDPNNNASTSAALVQTVNVPRDSINLRQMQLSTTPVIAQISGQAISGAIDNAINAGFSNNPQTVTPNGGGFTVQIPLDQPPATNVPNLGNGTGLSGGGGAGGFVFRRQPGNGPGSLANGREGGNGAPSGTRLIDMRVMPLPPGSGMPPLGETRFAPDQVVMQFASGTTPQQIAGMARRFGLTVLAQQTIGMLGRSVYTFRIANGQSVRAVIRAVDSARVNAAVQPNYIYRTQDENVQDPDAQDQNDPDADPDDQAQADPSNQAHAVPGDPAQYIVQKLHLAEAHQISKGDKVVVAVIDSEIDSRQPNLTGAIADRYDAGCGTTPPDAHGTGMAGAIAAHGQLLGVAPGARIIAICAFGGASQPQSNTLKIINGLDYAIQRGAKIVNMSFAGPRDPALSQALQVAREKGVLLIAAAGNGGPKSAPLYPGADPSVMAVTATDQNDRLFPGANQGNYVTIAAPGVKILVPAPDGGVQLTTGTSVATANVSGVAALLIAHKPNLTPEVIRQILVTTASISDYRVSIRNSAPVLSIRSRPSKRRFRTRSLRNRTVSRASSPRPMQAASASRMVSPRSAMPTRTAQRPRRRHPPPRAIGSPGSTYRAPISTAIHPAAI